MVVNYLNINGNSIMHAAIPIIDEDDACLFRSLSYIMNNNQEWFCHIRQSIVFHVIENCDRFSVFYESNNSDNYPDSNY